MMQVRLNQGKQQTPGNGGSQSLAMFDNGLKSGPPGGPGVLAFGPGPLPPDPYGIASRNPGGPPSPDGVPFYTGYPDRDGKLQERGTGNFVHNWLQDVSYLMNKYPQVNDARVQANQDFNAAMQKGTAGIEAAMRKDVPKGVAELNKKTNGEVGRLSREYQQERSLAGQSLTERKIAIDKADSAEFKVNIAQSEIGKHQLALEKKVLQGQEAALEGEISGKSGVAGKAIDYGAMIVKGNIQGFADEAVKDLGKVLVSGVLSGDAQVALMKVQAKIGAIDDQIEKTTDKQLKDQLKAAKKDLQASVREIALAEGEIPAAR